MRGHLAAARLCVRSELRARWRSWVVLGLLAGATVGLAASAIAGARRTDTVLPRYLATARPVHAAVLPNDPTFDADKRARVAALAEVSAAYPFVVPVFMNEQVTNSSQLVFTTVDAPEIFPTVIVSGRRADPSRSDEVVIDENTARKHHLRIGSTMTYGQQLPPSTSDLPSGFVPPHAQDFAEPLRVVGIAKSVTSEEQWAPSLGFAREHGDQIVGPVNMFVALRGGESDVARFQRDVDEILGHPTNVESASEINGYDKIGDVLAVERNSLVIFAIAVLLGGTVLVGQALFRAVVELRGDYDTWRAFGFCRRDALRAMTWPALLTAATALVTTGAVAFALSERYPIGTARVYETELGFHFDLPVIAAAAATAFVACIAGAWGSARWALARGTRSTSRPSTSGKVAAAVGLKPAAWVGLGFAVDPGRGRRAIPARSAMLGAVVGVLGVVAALTFRVAVQDAAVDPRRSGTVWDYEVANEPDPIAPGDEAAIAADPAVGAAMRATWVRAVTIDGAPTPVWGTTPLRGEIPFVVLSGRAPRADDELAVAPTTVRARHWRIGERVAAGNSGQATFTIVGSALLPTSSHTSYDAGAWTTEAGLPRAITEQEQAASSPEVYVLVRWAPGADTHQAEGRMVALSSGPGYYTRRAPGSVQVRDLGNLANVPAVLAVFFALLATAAVAHALVTVVRRRRKDLAVMRSVGMTRSQTRRAVAYPAGIFAAIGVAVGAPLGLAVGRLIWHRVAYEFPLAYVPPLDTIALLAAPVLAIAVSQALAAGPAHAATRIEPARVLRAE